MSTEPSLPFLPPSSLVAWGEGGVKTEPVAQRGRAAGPSTWPCAVKELWSTELITVPQGAPMGIPDQPSCRQALSLGLSFHL